jgi:hypothetical protein
MRIENGNIRLEDDEELSFGNSDDARIYWDGAQLVGATISGTTGGGASAFTDLTDVPSAYTDQAGKYVAVNGTADALEFVDAPEGGTATLSGVVAGDLDFYTNGANIYMGEPDTGAGLYGSIIMDINVSVATTSGTAHGIKSPRLFPTGGYCPTGELVQLNADRRVIPADLMTYPDRPIIGWANGVNATRSTYCDVVVFGGVGVSSTYTLGTGGRGKFVYSNPAVPGQMTTTEPSTAGDVYQIVGIQTGSSTGVFFFPNRDIKKVGEKLPATWRFEANGNDLELRFNDGDSWNLITTFSGTTE